MQSDICKWRVCLISKIYVKIVWISETQAMTFTPCRKRAISVKPLPTVYVYTVYMECVCFTRGCGGYGVQALGSSFRSHCSLQKFYWGSPNSLLVDTWAELEQLRSAMVPEGIQQSQWCNYWFATPSLMNAFHHSTSRQNHSQLPLMVHANWAGCCDGEKSHRSSTWM